MTVAVQRLILIEAADEADAEEPDHESMHVEVKVNQVTVWWPLMSEMEDRNESEQDLHDISGESLVHPSLARSLSILASLDHEALDPKVLPGACTDCSCCCISCNCSCGCISCSVETIRYETSDAVVYDIVHGSNQVSVGHNNVKLADLHEPYPIHLLDP